jgi:hypothetical protein
MAGIFHSAGLPGLPGGAEGIRTDGHRGRGEISSWIAAWGICPPAQAIQPTFSEQIFDVAIAERETHIQPNGAPDNRTRKLMVGNEIVMRHLT